MVKWIGAVLAAVVAGLVLWTITDRDTQPGNSFEQSMTDSPGGTQIGGDFKVEIDTRRKLSADALNALRAKVAALDPDSIKVTSNMGDGDALIPASQFATVFRDAGWSVTTSQAMFSPNPVRGLYLLTPEPPPEALIHALVPAFAELGYRLEYSPQPGREHVEIVVGIR